MAEETPAFSSDDEYDASEAGASEAGAPEGIRAPDASRSSEATEAAETGRAPGVGSARGASAGTEAGTAPEQAAAPKAPTASTTSQDEGHSAILSDPAVAMLMEVFPGRILSVEARGDGGDEGDDDDAATGGEESAGTTGLDPVEVTDEATDEDAGAGPDRTRDGLPGEAPDEVAGHS